MEHNLFDTTTKELIWDDPAAWLERMGIDATGDVEVVDSDATTLVSTADKVIKVGGDKPFLGDLEPHSYYDAEIVRTLWLRQVALDHRHNLPVLTVLILLHKRANSPQLAGTYTRELPDGCLTNRYDYRVVRLWKEDPEDYLNGGLSVVPLVPLTKVAKADLPGLIDRMGDRINAEPRPRASKFWNTTYLLMGARYTDQFARYLLRGVEDMLIESTTYQRILRDGRQDGEIQEGRRFLLRLGTKRFGEPDAATLAAIEAIHDPDRLEAFGERVIDADVRDWSDLLRA